MVRHDAVIVDQEVSLVWRLATAVDDQSRIGTERSSETHLGRRLNLGTEGPRTATIGSGRHACSARGKGPRPKPEPKPLSRPLQGGKSGAAEAAATESRLVHIARA
jgi:hypothetical protein